MEEECLSLFCWNAVSWRYHFMSIWHQVWPNQALLIWMTFETKALHQPLQLLMVFIVPEYPNALPFLMPSELRAVDKSVGSRNWLEKFWILVLYCAFLSKSLNLSVLYVTRIFYSTYLTGLLYRLNELIPQFKIQAKIRILENLYPLSLWTLWIISIFVTNHLFH